MTSHHPPQHIKMTLAYIHTIRKDTFETSRKFPLALRISQVGIYLKIGLRVELSYLEIKASLKKSIPSLSNRKHPLRAKPKRNLSMWMHLYH